MLCLPSFRAGEGLCATLVCSMCVLSVCLDTRVHLSVLHFLTEVNNYTGDVCLGWCPESQGWKNNHSLC